MTLRVLVLGVLVLLLGHSGGCKGAPTESPTENPAPSRPNYSELDAEEQCIAAIEFGDPEPPQQCHWGVNSGGADYCPPPGPCNKIGALQIVANTMTPGQHPTGFEGYFYVLFGEKPGLSNSAHRLICESFFRKVPDSSTGAMRQRVVTLWPTKDSVSLIRDKPVPCETLLSAYDYDRARSISDKLPRCMRPEGPNEVAIVGLESGKPITGMPSELNSVWGISVRGDDPKQVEAALSYWFNEVQDARKAGWFEALKARLGDSLEAIVKTIRGSECL